MDLPEELAARLRKLEAIVFDVDGVFTDGALYLGDDGTEMRRFTVRDGLGAKRLLDAGLRVAIISGRDSPIVARRMEELGVSPVIQGVAQKGPVFDQVLATLGVSAAATAAVGDDLPDIDMFERAGLAIAVADAQDAVRAAAHWVTRRPGGHGAVREISDAILACRT